MFTELYPLAKDAPIVMLIAADGDKLRVTIQQKDDADTPLSITVVATPAELDAELPAAIKQAAGTPDAPASVSDQVAQQLARAGSTASKPAKKAAPATPAAKPAASEPAKPDKTACLDDLAAMQAKYGDKLKRDLFMKESTTKRRFENLWGNWGKFLEAGKKRTAKAAPPAAPADAAPPVVNDDHNTLPLPLDAGSGNNGHAAPPAREGEQSPATHVDTTAGSSSAATEVSTPAGTAGTTTTTEPNAPQTAEAATPGPGTSSPGDTSASAAGHDGGDPAEINAPSVYTMSGQLICHALTVAPTEAAPGTFINHEGIEYRVRTVTPDKILVDDPAPPPVVRKLISDEGLHIGFYEGDPVAGADITYAGDTYAVLSVTPKVVMVEKAAVTA